jgi:hypothetical protein
MNQILGIGILIVFLFPLYFVYKEVKENGVSYINMFQAYSSALLFTAIGISICFFLGFGVFLILGG